MYPPGLGVGKFAKGSCASSRLFGTVWYVPPPQQWEEEEGKFLIQDNQEEGEEKTEISPPMYEVHDQMR
jgi:hypothetical protein